MSTAKITGSHTFLYLSKRQEGVNNEVGKTNKFPNQCIIFGATGFMLWACTNAENQYSSCTYVLCPGCKMKLNSTATCRKRHKVLTSSATYDHDITSIVCKDDPSY